ncbi:MAG: hypothetical protein AB8B51_10400 [Sedimentitalea sp.]
MPDMMLLMPLIAVLWEVGVVLVPFIVTWLRKNHCQTRKGALI